MLHLNEIKVMHSSMGMRAVAILLVAFQCCLGQDVLFSQFQYSPLVINPAYASADYDLQLTAHYRNQFRNPDPGFKTPSFTAIIPIVDKKTFHRRGGFGISAISDQSGNSNLTENSVLSERPGKYPFRLVNQGIALTYAHNIFMGRGYNLSLGLQGGYYQYGLRAEDLATSEQYSNNGGYNPGKPTGESFPSNTSISYFDLGSGLHFTKEDSIGRLFFAALSIFHINRPDLSFNTGANNLAMRYTANAGFRLFSDENVTVTPEILASLQGQAHRISIGSRVSYMLIDEEKKILNNSGIAIIPRYNLNNSVAVGIELSKSDFLIAFNYDFNTTPLADRIYATGAYEIAIGYRKFLGKKKEKTTLPDYTIGDVRRFYKADNVQDVSKKLAEDDKNNITGNQIADNDTTWNRTSESRFELEKRFTYGFNETGLGKDAKKFADEIVELMKDNKRLKLLVIGYTDNVGTEEVNLIVSHERAKAFVDYMKSKGINPSRLKSEGKGESESLNLNRNALERAKNRRVRFLLF